MGEVAGVKVPALFDINRSDGRAEITFLPNWGERVYKVTVADWKDESILPDGMLQNMVSSSNLWKARP